MPPAIWEELLVGIQAPLDRSPRRSSLCGGGEGLDHRQKLILVYRLMD
jgi:hypothetical protein